MSFSCNKHLLRQPPVTIAKRFTRTLHRMVKAGAEGIDRTFGALADATRRSILMRLMEFPGQSASELAGFMSLKLPGLTKHLDVLARAGLITRTRTGRSVSLRISPAPIHEAVDWLRRFEAAEAKRTEDSRTPP